MAPFLQWKLQTRLHYYLISNLRATDGSHYGNMSNYYGDQRNKNGHLHEAPASFSFSLFPKTAFNNNFSKTPLLKAQVGTGKSRYLQMFFCFVLFSYWCHWKSGEFVSVLWPCRTERCAFPAVLGDALVSETWIGQLLSLFQDLLPFRGHFNNDEPWTIAPCQGDSSHHSLQGLCASRGQVKTRMEDYFRGSGTTSTRTSVHNH